MFSCTSSQLDIGTPETCETGPTEAFVETYGIMNQALLATRFPSLNALKEAISIDHRVEPDSVVVLTHCSQGVQVVSQLKYGVHEGDFRNARDSSFAYQFAVLMKSPYAISHREELKQVYLLGRRQPKIFGEGDVAFFDLAQASVHRIYAEDQIKFSAKDTTEKGFINTFNHITAQALMTTIMSEEMADFVADVHERFHMPSLVTGVFSSEQLADEHKNPMDNYVDMINNEWGQEIGKRLKKEFEVTAHTVWTPALLTAYMNALVAHYSWAFQIRMKPFSSDDELMIRYAKKMNRVLKDTPTF